MAVMSHQMGIISDSTTGGCAYQLQTIQCILHHAWNLVRLNIHKLAKSYIPATSVEIHFKFGRTFISVFVRLAVILSATPSAQNGQYPVDVECVLCNTVCFVEMLFYRQLSGSDVAHILIGS